MLAKLQIIEMTMTDVMDVGVILATHQVARRLRGPRGHRRRAHRRAARPGDWGFHHTATRNLRRIAGLVGDCGGDRHRPRENAQVARRVRRLLAAIDAEPKTLAWRMRDKIGERKQWWQDVDEKEATY